VVRRSYAGIGFNTKVIPPAKAPKTYDDLLAPEWRGRMAMSGSISTINFVGTLMLAHGEVSCGSWATRFSSIRLRGRWPI
jgi:ABC-type Fe3+ transport system substrate-binding protein